MDNNHGGGGAEPEPEPEPELRLWLDPGGQTEPTSAFRRLPPLDPRPEHPEPDRNPPEGLKVGQWMCDAATGSERCHSGLLVRGGRPKSRRSQRGDEEKMKIMPEKEVPAPGAAGKTWQGVESRLRQQGGVGQRVCAPELPDIPRAPGFVHVGPGACMSGHARARRAGRVHVGPAKRAPPGRRARERSLPFCYMLTCASRRAPF